MKTAEKNEFKLEQLFFAGSQLYLVRLTAHCRVNLPFYTGPKLLHLNVRKERAQIVCEFGFN